MPKPISDIRRRAVLHGYRSGMEERVNEELKAAGIERSYEILTIPYVVPEAIHRYTADFLLPNGIVVETKGRFLASDRTKHLLIKKQYPDLDLRFLFQRAAAPIYKGSKTSCAAWAEKHGFLWAEGHIPEAWLREVPAPERLVVLKLFKHKGVQHVSQSPLPRMRQQLR